MALGHDRENGINGVQDEWEARDNGVA